jgi:hypothetical protein
MYAFANSSALRSRYVGHRPRVGMGQTQQQIVSAGGQAAGATIGALVATGAIAGPVGAVAGAAVGLVVTLINTFFAPNVQKIQASNDANQIEAILQNNLANWLALPASQKFQSVQAAALAVFNQGWAQYQQLVQPDLAKAPNSISDRQEGSCAYHTAQCAGWNNGVYTPNGPNQSTGCCWNWFIGYYDPIANDPNVQADPSTGSSDATAAASALNDVVSGNVSAAVASVSGVSDWVWIGLAALAAYLVFA